MARFASASRSEQRRQQDAKLVGASYMAAKKTAKKSTKKTGKKKSSKR
jgi:hypothetical protein